MKSRVNYRTPVLNKKEVLNCMSVTMLLSNVHNQLMKMTCINLETEFDVTMS